MSSSLNQFTVTGRLARDPETKYLPSGISVTEFTVAVSDSYKPKEGERVEKTYWLRAKAWGKFPGEVIAKHFKKGDPIGISGKIVQEEWETDGKKQSKTLLEVHDFVFMGGKKSDLPSGAAGKIETRAPEAPEDDIPY